MNNADALCSGSSSRSYVLNAGAAFCSPAGMVASTVGATPRSARLRLPLDQTFLVCCNCMLKLFSIFNNVLPRHVHALGSFALMCRFLFFEPWWARSVRQCNNTRQGKSEHLTRTLSECYKCWIRERQIRRVLSLANLSGETPALIAGRATGSCPRGASRRTGSGHLEIMMENKTAR